MPRENRYFLPGHVWHITHRCHKKEFLLKFSKDRKRWCYWLFETKKRNGLSGLNFIITSNHIHLLAINSGRGVIARSMQLIAVPSWPLFTSLQNSLMAESLLPAIVIYTT